MHQRNQQAADDPLEPYKPDYAKLIGGVRRTVHRVLPPQLRPESVDIADQVFWTLAWRHLRLNNQEFPKYLFKWARDEAKSYVRKWRRQFDKSESIVRRNASPKGVVSSADEVEDAKSIKPLETLIKVDERYQVLSALAKLTPMQVDSLVPIVDPRVTLTSIASKYKCSVECVRQNQKKATTSLRAMIIAFDHDEAAEFSKSIVDYLLSM